METTMNRWRALGILMLTLTLLLSLVADVTAQGRTRTGSARERRQRFPTSNPRGVPMGLALKAAPEGSGWVVTRVLPDGPASKAGLVPGDVLVQVDGESLTAPLHLAQAWAALSGGQHIEVGFLREGALLTVRLVRPQTPGSAAESLMKEAGGRVAWQPPDSPSQRVGQFNVLRTALVAPDGRVTLLGTYDPTWPTGPLPYQVLLREALENPAPSLSLELVRDAQEDARLRQVLDQEAPRIRDDTAYGVAWVQRFMDLLWRADDLEADRRLFAARLEEGFGITREEFEVFRQWRNSPKGPSTPPPVREYMRKYYAGAGLPEVGRALSLMNLFQEDNSSHIMLEIGEVLGLGSQVRPLVDRILALPEGNQRLEPTLELLSLVYGELLTRLKAPPDEARDILTRFRAGRADDTAVMAVMDRASQAFMAEAMGRKLLHGFNLSQDLLGRMYRLPELQARVETFSGPLNSATSRIFLNADYRLKGYCAEGGPEGLRPDLVYLFDERERQGMGSEAVPEMLRVRYWLTPDQVHMQSSPDGSVVRFGEADIRLRSQVLEAPGADPASQAFLSAASEGYAREISSRYEALARQSPNLHALREVAKVVALVRSARELGLELQAPNLKYAGPPVPETVPGLWGATFLVSHDLAHNELQFWRSGGVDFSPEEGGWAQPTESPTVSNDVLRQLAASTALAEQAATAAGQGALEEARELAEMSAQAMVGALPEVPEAVLSPAATPVGEADISQAALQAVEANLQALETSQATLLQAEPLKQTSPEAYAQAVKAARESEVRTMGNLQRLQDYLDQYRQSPTRSSELAVELQGLGRVSLLRESPVAGSTPSTAAGQTPGAGGRPASPGAQSSAPSRAGNGPGQEQLLADLEGLRADLARLTRLQAQLGRSMWSDVVAFEDWQSQVERSYARSWSNLQGLLESEALYYAKKFLTFKKAPQADLDALQRLGETLAVRDVVQWSQEQEKDWEWVGKAIVQLAGVSGLDDELKRVVVAGSAFVDMGVDLSTYYVAWRDMEKMRVNQAAYEEANRANREAMTRLIQRIRELEARLKTETPGT